MLCGFVVACIITLSMAETTFVDMPVCLVFFLCVCVCSVFLDEFHMLFL